jgi:hypothetical protein
MPFGFHSELAFSFAGIPTAKTLVNERRSAALHRLSRVIPDANRDRFRELTATVTATRMEKGSQFGTHGTDASSEVHETICHGHRRTRDLRATNQKVGCSNHSGRTST